MSEYEKDICKAMIRQAMAALKKYNRLTVATYADKQLLWEGMEAVLDWLPGVSEYRKFMMRDYCDRVMHRLLGI